MEDDLKYHPEWEQYVPNPSVFGKDLNKNMVIAAESAVALADKIISNCPFASLFQ